MPTMDQIRLFSRSVELGYKDKKKLSNSSTDIKRFIAIVSLIVLKSLDWLLIKREK